MEYRVLGEANIIKVL